MIPMPTLARPYAKALFTLALQHNQVAQWSKVLAVLAQVAEEKSLKNYYHHPQLKQTRLAELFYEIAQAAKVAQPEVKNFLLLLAHYQRLQMLPMIAQLFEEDRAQLEKTLQVSVTSALPVKENMRQRLQQALEIRLQRAIKMEFLLDKNLLGGAIIRAGDLVIDGSVRSKLEKLKHAVVN